MTHGPDSFAKRWWQNAQLRLTLRAALAYRAAWWACTKREADELTPETLPSAVNSVRKLLDHLGEVAVKELFPLRSTTGSLLEVRSCSVGRIHLQLSEDTESEVQSDSPRVCGHFSTRDDDGILELYLDNLGWDIHWDQGFVPEDVAEIERRFYLELLGDAAKSLRFVQKLFV